MIKIISFLVLTAGARGQGWSLIKDTKGLGGLTKSNIFDKLLCQDKLSKKEVSKMYFVGFMVFLGLLAGNFIYQGIAGKQKWSRAIEISFFQAIALFAYL